MSRSDKDLDCLDMILAALPQKNLPMTVSELDGYVTGILACSDLISPSEWLPHVWGETGDAGFPDEATAETTISAVMAHYNAVAANITTIPWIDPIYEMDPNSNETLWEAWIGGFTCAMRLRPEAWQALLKQADEKVRSSLIFLLVLQDINEGTSTFSEEEIEEVDLHASDLIPSCVAAILLVSRPELIMKADNLSHAPVRGTRPARNEPCPCGSGRKYKQCCGKN